MAETTQFVSKISVKDLISAFESKSETVRVEFSRPRARSFGNVLNKNVVVRLSEYTTLQDIEQGLTKLETDLNFYEVYNKAKHVAFQEQFFSILTSIASIENEEEDAPTRKKRLISRTQTLVSFLNQKLPSNINQVIETKSNAQYKYTPYSSYIKENPKINFTEPRTENITESNTKPMLYVESGSDINVTNSDKEYIVSVRKLKANFQQKDEIDGEPAKQEQVVQINKKTNVTTNAQNTEKSEPNTNEHKEEVNIYKEERPEAVSVTKLRNLFEHRSEENSKGLEIITVDKPQLAKTILGGSVQNVSIPYTERNLGNLRLQRSVSGNYMNYTGLLKRVDINRSNSAINITKNNTEIAREISSDEESDAESDVTLQNRNEPVKIEEINDSYGTAVLEEHGLTPEQYSVKQHVAFIEASKDKEIDNTKYEIPIHETEVNYSSATVTPVNQKQYNNISKEYVANLQGFGEEEVNYSKANIESDKEDDSTENSEEELLFEGVDEIEVNQNIAYSKDVITEEHSATLEVQLKGTGKGDEDDENSEEELYYEGVDEMEVNQGVALSKDIGTEEHTAKFEGQKEEISQSTNGNLGNSSNTKNEKASNLQGFEEDINYYKVSEKYEEGEENTVRDPSFTSVNEEDVTYEIAERKNIQTEENTARLEAGTDDESHSVQLSRNVGEEIPIDDQYRKYIENSMANRFYDSDDERELSLIEEEMDKIDVEQTLANVDLVVNPEDLKNADDEFEKLIESSGKGKLIV